MGPPGVAVLVAHSLGCQAAVRWTARRRAGIAGVFLVAPPDRAGALFPAAAATFAVAAERPVEAAGLIVSSDDDPYCSGDVAGRLATTCALPGVSAGPVGHTNSASRLGRWDTRHALLTGFSTGLRAERGDRPAHRLNTPGTLGRQPGRAAPRQDKLVSRAAVLAPADLDLCPALTHVPGCLTVTRLDGGVVKGSQ